MIDFKALSQGKKVSLVLISVLILALSGYLIYKVINPTKQMIYQEQSLEALSKVTSQLDQQGIEYSLDDSGTGILVDESLANNVKVSLAGAQAVEGKNVGFELFDNLDYSMTEQAQKITYQRALQGELERTLSAYQEIEQARVHIMIPQRKLFSAEQSKAKASVSLIAQPGVVLSNERISGVQALIAASVEGLVAKDVIVLNGEGVQISEQNDGDQLPGKPQSKGQLALEQQLTEKAYRLLALYFNPAQVAVSVSAELSYTQTKTVTKALLGDSEERGFVTRKKERVDYRKASKDEPSPAPNKEIETEYNHGVDTEERLSYAGSIKKLNVAIAILADLSDVERDKLSSLVAAGLGIDHGRGDQLSVESFEPPATVQAPVNEEPIVAMKPDTVQPKQPEVIYQPTKAELPWWQIDPLWYVLALAVVMLLLLLGGNRRKGLNQAEKEQTMAQFNQWLGHSKVEQNVG